MTVDHYMYRSSLNESKEILDRIIKSYNKII